MRTEDCYYLGYIVKTAGVEGALIASFEVDDIRNYKDLESVFIQIEGKLVPFFIEDLHFRSQKNEVLIRFEDIDSIEKARHLCDHDMYLSLDQLPEPSRDAFHYHDLKGYKACDKQGNYLGNIVEILDYPGNPVFLIHKGQQEIMIPVNDAFILKILHKERRIDLNPPDGLLDLYT